MPSNRNLTFLISIIIILKNVIKRYQERDITGNLCRSGTSLTSALNNFVVNSTSNTTLSTYITITSLTSSMSSYVTNTSLKIIIVILCSLTSSLSNYARLKSPVFGGSPIFFLSTSNGGWNIGYSSSSFDISLYNVIQALISKSLSN